MELETKWNIEIQSEMLETMRSFKATLDSLKADNIKLMNAKLNQEEINEIILKFWHNRNWAQNLTATMSEIQQ